MQHDVEAEGEGDDEEGVPDEEQEERLEHLVQHRDVHVVSKQTLTNEGFSFGYEQICRKYFGLTSETTPKINNL